MVLSFPYFPIPFGTTVKPIIPIPATVDDLKPACRIHGHTQVAGLHQLHLPQRESLVHMLAGENIALALPTASGRTLVALHVAPWES